MECQQKGVQIKANDEVRSNSLLSIRGAFGKCVSAGCGIYASDNVKVEVVDSLIIAVSGVSRINNFVVVLHNTDIPDTKC